MQKVRQRSCHLGCLMKKIKCSLHLAAHQFSDLVLLWRFTIFGSKVKWWASETMTSFSNNIHIANLTILRIADKFVSY